MTDQTTNNSKPDKSPSAKARENYGQAVRVCVWMLEFPDASAPERVIERLESQKIVWAAEEDALEYLAQVRSERAEALSKLRGV